MTNEQVEMRLRAHGSYRVPPDLQERLEQTIPSTFREPERRWRQRRSWKMAKLGMLTAAAAAALVLGYISLGNPGRANADVLKPVATASGNVAAVHLTLRALSRDGEDFSYVNLQGSMQPLEVWVEAPTKTTASGRMRVEKSDRMYVFDGKTSTFYFPSRNEVLRQSGGKIDYRVLWPATWVDEIWKASSSLRVVSYDETNGRARMVTHQDGPAMNGRQPAHFDDFERETELEWDLGSKQLTGLRRFVYASGARTLVMELVTIEYPARLADSLFTVQLRSDVREAGVLKAPADIIKLEPREVARRFWQAAIDGDWETVRLYCPAPSMIDWLKQNRPTKLVELGTAFRSGSYPGVFVPYKVEMTIGGVSAVLSKNLALRNDNPDGRYVFDGGI